MPWRILLWVMHCSFSMCAALAAATCKGTETRLQVQGGEAADRKLLPNCVLTYSIML